MPMAFIRFLVYSNIWIAFGAALLTNASCMLFSKFSLPPMGLAFFGTLAGYNWLRWLSLKFGKHETLNDRLSWLNSRKRLIWLLIFVGGAGVLALLPSLTWTQTAIASTTFLITACYGIPVSAFKNKAIRQIPLLKIFLITLCWVSVTVIIPLSSNTTDSTFYIYCTAQLLFIFGITIPFDIRDIESDSPGNFTIAQRLGLKGAKILSIMCMPAVIYFYSILPIPSLQILALTTPVIVAIPLLLMATPNRNDLYFTGLIDGMMVLQGGLVWCLSA